VVRGTRSLPRHGAKGRICFLPACSGGWRSRRRSASKRRRPARRGWVPYLDGLIHGALEVDPAMRGAFSELFTSSLCGGELGEDQATTLAYAALMLPDIPTAQGFDCFFGKAKEGFAFWTMLDAWWHSGMEETPLLAEIRAKATDPRTVRRFSAPQDSASESGAWPTAVGTLPDPIARQ